MRLDHQEIGARGRFVLRCRSLDASLEEGRPRLRQTPVRQNLLDGGAGLRIDEEGVNVGALNDGSPYA
jgi:hypothetical protein